MDDMKLMVSVEKLFNLTLFLVIGSLLNQCSGSGFEANSNSSSSTLLSNEKVFDCNPTESRHPLQSSNKRLSIQQYQYSLQDLADNYFSPTETQALMIALQPALANIPDEHHEKMNIFDKSVTQSHLEKYIAVGETFADYIVANATLRNKIFGACHSDSENATCTNNFIESFGKLSAKRPLSQAQKDHFLSLFNENKSEGYRNLLATFLSSPFFIFNLEFGDPEAATFAGHVQLSQYEIAAKLSYFYLQSLPDLELLEAAANRKLRTKLQIEKQIQRLIKLPKVRKRLTRSFANQWLKVDETPQIDDSTEDMKAILNSFTTAETNHNRREHIMQEVYQYFDYLIWEQQAGFKELMSSNFVFPRSDDLAEIYGTATWNGSYELTSLVRTPQSERSGLLTLAHTLFTGVRSTRPIMRGVHFYQRFLCGDLPAPADNSTPEGIVLEDNFSERQRVKAMTEAPGSSCVTCHSHPINPLGFAFEQFDSFGRFRINEDIYHNEASPNKGQVLLSQPVDSKVSFQFPKSKEKDYSGGVDLSYDLASNAQAQACFARTLWRFANSYYYKIGEGECASQEIYKSGLNQGSILDMFKAVPLQPEFILKKVE